MRRADEPAPVNHASAPTVVGGTTDEPERAAVGNGVIRVESPMVGVFYRASNPGAPPFVEVGDTVAPGQTLCVLEAMKLFNELKAEVDGTVRAVHVDNGSAVEYGQLLFEIELIVGPPVL